MDDVTLALWLGLWPALGVLELVVVVLRARARPGEPRPRVISVLAKERAPHLTAAVYLWAAMPTHWWWNAARWGPDALAWAFWGIPVALAAWDAWTWRENPAAWPAWQRRVRHPLVWLVVGALAGRFLFPQAAS